MVKIEVLVEVESWMTPDICVLAKEKKKKISSRGGVFFKKYQVTYLSTSTVNKINIYVGTLGRDLRGCTPGQLPGNFR